ncbi:MAG: tyrosine-type recombinase/integrase [Planctomycetes bacterium]|nr:tyrosine-type recombinase/integrase [Planctomycetota bacterium]
MSRQAKPWFYNQTGWWMAWINGKKVKLAKGRRSKKAAQERLEDLRVLARHNPSPESHEQTVVSVIERYIEVRFPPLAKSTVAQRKPYLQSFAEMHGWREVRECRTDNLEEWLNCHPEWESDWTKRDAVMAVHTAFNWAVNARRIAANPFKGFSQKAGSARRDITPDEFQALLRGTASRHRRKPTPGARFRQVLFFLSFTGCRPSEARHLQWADVDFERRTITLRSHKTIRMQRTPRPRIVPLHPVVVRLLQAITL